MIWSKVSLHSRLCETAPLLYKRGCVNDDFACCIRWGAGGVICSSSPQSCAGSGRARSLGRKECGYSATWQCSINTRANFPPEVSPKFIINIRKRDLLSFCSNHPCYLTVCPDGPCHRCWHALGSLSLGKDQLNLVYLSRSGYKSKIG